MAKKIEKLLSAYSMELHRKSTVFVNSMANSIKSMDFCEKIRKGIMMAYLEMGNLIHCFSLQLVVTNLHFFSDGAKAGPL